MPSTTKKTARLWLRLEPDLKDALQQLALVGPATVNGLVRQAIREYLAKPQVKAILKTPLLAYASALFFMID